MNLIYERKENTHIKNKSEKGKYLAWKKYNCQQCRGICIFSPRFFEKYQKSASLRAKLNEEFCGTELKYLRSLLETSPTDETDENFAEDEKNDPATIFAALKKFHSLGSRAELTGHTYAVYSEKRPNKLDRYDLWRICRCCLRKNIPKRESREKRHTKLIFNSLGDIRLPC